MVNKKPDSSVHDEQYRLDEVNDNPETSGDTDEIVEPENEKIEIPEDPHIAESVSKDTPSEEVEDNEPLLHQQENSVEETPDQSETDDPSPANDIGELMSTGEDENLPSDENTGETFSEKEEDKELPSDEETSGAEKIDYSALSREDLVATMKDLLDKGSVLNIKDDIDLIKQNFYKKTKAEYEKKKKKFLDEGGEPEDFKPEEDPLERDLKDYLSKYKDYRLEYNKIQEDEKQRNLESKYKIIEDIKDLVNRKESINKTFQEFRDLQKHWRETGPVPQVNLNDLWESYHHNVETFYDYIKINQELRDLDLKKNLESKLLLCEKAEELLLEPSVVTAFNKLQSLHAQWREIGPVPPEMRTEIWKRFKETTTKINKKHQEYFLNQKHEQKKNLEAKSILCEKAEEISTSEIENYSDWEKKSAEIIELQKVWRTLGFAPKKDNTIIYNRFREACDKFFNRKREYMAVAKQEYDDNLQLKMELCIQAEALQDSTEWKKTTEEMIALQKRWKEIGPVSQKISEKIWKRFRSACDNFFNKKNAHFSTIDTSYSENLRKKEELIKEIETFELSTNVEENLNKLKEFQRVWASIGFVPYESKDAIQEKYRKVVNKKFDALKIDEEKKNIIKFKSKLDNLTHKSNSNYRMYQERDKFVTRLKQLESDIVLWENNIGFFAKSKNAESMINEVKKKIADAKSKIEVLTEKIRMIDDLDE
jgi:hypothetical protein